MDRSQVEPERQALHEGISGAMVSHEDVAFVTKWVVIAETVMSDGHRELHTRSGSMEGDQIDGVKTWEALGMLHVALLNAEQSSREASVSAVDGDEDD